MSAYSLKPVAFIHPTVKGLGEAMDHYQHGVNQNVAVADGHCRSRLRDASDRGSMFPVDVGLCWRTGDLRWFRGRGA